jgi:RNA polymerase sigma-70 factor (ECF subfamily)
MNATGLEAVFLANRERLLAFLRAHGAGEAAEDLLQELWLKVAAAPAGPIAQPLSYLYRAANNLMLDRYRSQVQAARRDQDWTEATTTAGGQCDEPSSERRLIAREQLQRAQETLEALGPRPAAIFRRHRIDGVPQRAIAAEFGISLSTVEADLRRAYAAMIELRNSFDEA